MILLSIGHGYSAQALARRIAPERVIGTSRSVQKAQAFGGLVWPGDDLPFETATHLLCSVSPDAEGDPVLRVFRDRIAARKWDWIGYLSTVGVYGDTGGDWVDEDSPTEPGTRRGQERLAAEEEWRALGAHVFRLAGIYGPGRGPFEKVRSGKARRIIKPGQVFSRIHCDDIAQVLAASMARPNPGRVYNVCDDEPAPPQDVLAHAADLLHLPRPPEVDFDQAEMSPMARSFYAANRRVRNDRIKTELGVRLLYPDYRAGLAQLLRAEGG